VFQSRIDLGLVSPDKPGTTFECKHRVRTLARALRKLGYNVQITPINPSAASQSRHAARIRPRPAIEPSPVTRTDSRDARLE
jgi:hypothetical protein